ncbi:MAG: YkgJ family cysteine cluster protein [Planctomycetes bacterium]|nr:YkgJ family cysteine cluster protein [Planctomycetota bacterium]
MGSGSGEVWYGDGLAFACQGCGECCRGPGGYVWLTMEEARDIAADLGQEFTAFAAAMLRTTTSGLALVDDNRGDCPLLGEDGRCRVYAARPRQCRTWPWWDENLATRERWESAAARCPGVNRGERHSRLYIDSERAKEF